MASTPTPPSVQTDGPSVSKAGAIMVGSLFLSRVLGLVRDAVIGSQFGLLLPNDTYRIATQIPDLLFMLIAGGGLSSAFIPVFSEFLYTKREREAWKVFSVVVTICSLIVLALIGIAWIFAPQIVQFIGGGKPPSIFPTATLMSRIMLPAQFAFLIGSILLGTLYARKQFLAPGLAPNVYNLGIILGAALLPRLFGFGIVGVAWGALAGALIGNLLLPTLTMIKLGSHFRPSLDIRAPGVRNFFALLLPVILGFSLPSMVNLVTQKFSSHYGDGANTALAYSNNLMQAPLGIFGQSLALAAFPVLAQLVAQGRMDLYRGQISRTLRTVLYLCIPSSVLMWALAQLITNLIYGHGKAQTAGNEQQLLVIASCLRIYCVAIWAWCMQPILMRGFFSLHKTLKPMVLGTAMTVLFITECAIAGRMPFNLYVLPWATNIAAILLVVILYFALESDVGKLDRVGIVSTLFKSAVAAVPLGVVAYAGAAYYSSDAYHNLAGTLERTHVPAKLFGFGLLLLVSVLAAWAYYFAGRALKMPESEYVAKAMARFNRRKAPDL